MATTADTSAGLEVTEVHPVLSAKEMEEISEFRKKLAYKRTDEVEKLIYEWTKTGKLTFRQHRLLAQYHYQGY